MLSTMFADAALIVIAIGILSLLIYLFYTFVKAAYTGVSSGRRLGTDERITFGFLAFIPVATMLFMLALITA